MATARTEASRREAEAAANARADALRLREYAQKCRACGVYLCGPFCGDGACERCTAETAGPLDDTEVTQQLDGDYFDRSGVCILCRLPALLNAHSACYECVCLVPCVRPDDDEGSE